MLRIARGALRCVRGTRTRCRAQLFPHRHCERSEEIQSPYTETVWIASSQGLLAMTERGVMTSFFQFAFPIADTPLQPRGSSARALLGRLTPLERATGVGVDRRSDGLKAGADAPPPSAADGLDPVCTPVFGLGMRSAEVRARDRRARQATMYRFGSQVWPRAIMVLRMMISLRMQATIAIFGGLPLAIRRS